MTVFAIGDLHLPGGDVKPMDVFGAHWERHFERIRADWLARVKDEDVVLIPGDISWAMRLSEAVPDLEEIGRLPGHKLLVRGNHDYWWNSISRLRDILPPGMRALQNDALMLDGVLFAGTRGWSVPLNADDTRIYEREISRLTLSLRAARALSETAPLIVMTHFPPLSDGQLCSPITELMETYGVLHAVYGHLHGAAGQGAFRGVLNRVHYWPVACDGLGFRLCELPPIEPNPPCFPKKMTLFQ